jgi:hypothetical protein
VLGLGQGVVGAATGILSQPIESGAEGGWGLGSVLKGVGKGLVGVVTKPIGGAADLIAQTSGGMMQEAGIGPAAGPQLMRPRRALVPRTHPALRFKWKVLPAGESFAHCERVELAGVVVEAVLTSHCLRFFSVFAGRGATDLAPLAAYRWRDVLALNESFEDGAKLTAKLVLNRAGARKLGLLVLERGDSLGSHSSQGSASEDDSRAGAQRPCELFFASKAERRNFVKLALALQRRAHGRGNVA